MSEYRAMDQDIATAWDRHSNTYATLFAPLTNYIGRSMVTMAAPRLASSAAVLDIACGPGAVALPALELALGRGAGSVVATDISPAMVELARAGGARLGAKGDMFRCEVQNGEALTFADKSFDAVFSCFGIFLFGDRKKGWSEAARVLRPGGTLVTSVWQGPQTNQMLREQITPLMKALPPHLLPKPGGGWLEIAAAEPLAAEVAASGPFVDIRVTPFHASIAIVDPVAAWDALRENPVMGGLIAKCSDSELSDVRKAFVDHLAALAGDGGPVVFESVCNILTARRAD
jgi:ubiquinone/menaquinone biosynthesis C-methylase UbiE